MVVVALAKKEERSVGASQHQQPEMGAINPTCNNTSTFPFVRSLVRQPILVPSNNNKLATTINETRQHSGISPRSAYLCHSNGIANRRNSDSFIPSHLPPTTTLARHYVVTHVIQIRLAYSPVDDSKAHESAMLLLLGITH